MTPEGMFQTVTALITLSALMYTTQKLKQQLKSLILR